MKKELEVNVWDWIMTKDGVFLQITHDDMHDIKYEDIKRKATKEEIKKWKTQK